MVCQNSDISAILMIALLRVNRSVIGFKSSRGKPDKAEGAGQNPHVCNSWARKDEPAQGTIDVKRPNPGLRHL